MFGIDDNRASLADLRSALKLQSFKKGKLILLPNEENDHIYSISKGLVKAFNINSRDEEAIIVIYGPGDLFPLPWIIGQQRQPLAFKAITDSEVAVLPKKLFLDKLQTDSVFSFSIMQQVLDQFVLYVSRVNNLQLKFGRERLAYRLLLLGARFGKKYGNEIHVPYVSQVNLAAMINVSREGVNREMARFERLGILTTTKNQLVIKKPGELQKELGENVNIMYEPAVAPPGKSSL